MYKVQERSGLALRRDCIQLRQYHNINIFLTFICVIPVKNYTNVKKINILIMKQTIFVVLFLIFLVSGIFSFYFKWYIISGLMFAGVICIVIITEKLLKEQN